MPIKAASKRKLVWIIKLVARLVFRRFIIFGFLIFLANPSFADSSTQAQRERIITLSPHLTEMVFSAGAGADLVGVASYSNYPPSVTSLPVVSDAYSLNFERILSLKPTLILAWSGSTKLKDVQRLKDLGFKVYVSDIQNLNDIPDQIEIIGRRAHSFEKAHSKAQTLRHRLSELEQEYAYAKPIATFYEIWHQPMTTVNGQQFISQGLAICHAQNVFADLSPIAPQVNLEGVLMKNPQLILMGGPKTFQQQWLKDWQKYPMIQAVSHHQLIGVNSDLYQRPTERFIEALPELCQQVDLARKAYQ